MASERVAPMEGCTFRAALIVTLWVVLNTSLNLFNKWALTPPQVELSWSSSLIRMSVAGRWAGAGFGFPLFYSMCHMIASFLGASLIFPVRRQPRRCSSSTSRVAGRAFS